MKLLVTSDIHGDISILKKIKELYFKEKPDFIILLGDLANFGDLEQGLIGYLTKDINPYKIIFIPGNHETPDMIEFLSKIYKIKALHKDIVAIPEENIILAGIGGGDVPLFMVSDTEIKEFLDDIKEAIKKYGAKVIILSHVHPRYTESSKIGGGSKVLYEFIKHYNPLLVVHGHIHEMGGLEEILYKTKIVNTARSIFIIEVGDDKIKTKKLD